MMMMMVIREQPPVNENLAIEIWNCILFVDTYFSNKNSKALIAIMLVVFPIEHHVSEMTIGLLFYFDAKTEMLINKPRKVC